MTEQANTARTQATAPRPAAPAVQGEPVVFDEDAALSLAERVFYTEIDEQLATDIVRYARRLHTLYATPQPATEQQPDVTQLVEALTQLLSVCEMARADEEVDCTTTAGCYFVNDVMSDAVDEARYVLAHRKQEGTRG